MENTQSPSSFWRQLDIYNPDKDKQLPVTIIGCGGIGSFVGVGLAKLGIKDIVLIDGDSVEDHNVANQLYLRNDVGFAKTTSLSNAMLNYGMKGAVVGNKMFVKPETILTSTGIVISGVDSMEARKIVWEKVKTSGFVQLYIDGRLGGNVIKIFCIDPAKMSDTEYYENTLHSDEQSAELPCTAAGIIDVGFSVGSLITRAVRRFLKSNEYDRTLTYDHENLQFYKF
jgi:molybdopterin-synthase adenylyltransferase